MVMEALSAISTAMDLGKKARDLSKRLGDQELRELLADQQDALLDVREENQRLRAEASELKIKLEQKTNVTFRDGSYWLKGDDVPHCKLCKEVDGNMVHMDWSNNHWQCSVCSGSFAG